MEHSPWAQLYPRDEDLSAEVIESLDFFVQSKLADVLDRLREVARETPPEQTPGVGGGAAAAGAANKKYTHAQVRRALARCDDLVTSKITDDLLAKARKVNATKLK